MIPAVVLLCGGLILTLALGTRQSFGLFLRPTDAGVGTLPFYDPQRRYECQRTALAAVKGQAIAPTGDYP